MARREVDDIETQSRFRKVTLVDAFSIIGRITRARTVERRRSVTKRHHPGPGGARA